MKKKVRVDFVAHYSVVVAVEDSDIMYDDACNIAEDYIRSNPSVRPLWEIEDDGVEDVDDSEEAIN